MSDLNEYFAEQQLDGNESEFINAENDYLAAEDEDYEAYCALGDCEERSGPNLEAIKKFRDWVDGFRDAAKRAGWGQWGQFAPLPDPNPPPWDPEERPGL